MYSNFDDEHLRENGFRLPADPYWLAPPQGSLVPLWHRGGSPNYQPKPLICRHVQDPIKAWRRKAGSIGVETQRSRDARAWLDNAAPQTSRALKSIRVHYCSSGTVAKKLARRLHGYATSGCVDSAAEFKVEPFDTLNALKLSEIQEGDVILIIASSCGRGEVPYNGRACLRKLKAPKVLSGVRFAVYGNGSSSYNTSYNGAAYSVEQVLRDCGARPLLKLFEGDTDKESPPWKQLSTWWAAVHSDLFAVDGSISPRPQHTLLNNEGNPPHRFEILAASTTSAKLVSSSSNIKGIKHVTLDVGDAKYEEMSHVDVYIPNRRIKVEQVLAYMDLTGRNLKLSDDLTTQEFVAELVDLEAPFTDIKWTSRMNLDLEQQQMLKSTPFPQALKVLPPGWRKQTSLSEVFAAMPLIRPRTFSVASSQRFWRSNDRGNVLELLVQTHPRGLFSERFLTFSPRGTSLRIRFRPANMELIEDESPMIAFATGSGIAPIRSLLQARILDAQSTQRGTEASRSRYGPISLFIGFKGYDTNVAAGTLDRASELGLVDMLFLTPSNVSKVRSQDKMFADGVRHRIAFKIKEENARVFVCASPEAAKDFARNLSAVLGRDIKDALGERYIEEVFDPTG
ncbi:Flavodoxin/nitric oxide synthase [Macrophomina phaseolina MS6]|uniref:NADPH--hemoprotein reductase n=1 Tax=Macrophomina phaseolina (strain MS6) TaxID=1126212 RepID=K2RDU3_MACPH|nr:Flavodoxin/nitric oxide synthase [Macrophomina phaseolina MS6]